MAFLTLLDLARRMDPDGGIDDIAELLSQANEIFKDLLWVEGNLPFGHKFTVRTALPTATWRSAYQGLAGAVSKTAQLTADTAELAAISQIDKSVADMNGNTAKNRMSEDNAFLEGMSQQMAGNLFYGNRATAPTQFTGFSPLFNTATSANAANAKNVIGAGGTGSSNCSMWLVGHGDRTVYGIYPQGSKAGLVFEDRGDINFAYDASNNPFRAYTSYFEWKAGLVVNDWRYVVRICNIDVTAVTAGLQGSSPPDLFQLMSRAVIKLPTGPKRLTGITETDAPDEPAPGMNPVWYVNRTVREFLDIQAIRDKNVLLKPTEYAGEPVVDFRGAPIRIMDQLTTTEATVV